LDTSLLEHVELFVTFFLGLAKHVSSLEVGVARSEGDLLQLLAQERLKDVDHGLQSYLIF
jgi:hypothetical protein